MLGAPLPAITALLVLGVLTLFRRGAAAPAIAVLLPPVAAIGPGVAGIYPLLDPRTSHFLIVTMGPRTPTPVSRCGRRRSPGTACNASRPDRSQWS
ncbi:hypothetical protein [Micromonospora sp. NPDC049645]|uniref:hypothetical protein n=1 Tax=Micromonospora sp. NPDC049645 TaxID=3155508 RepID=UPI003441AFDA